MANCLGWCFRLQPPAHCHRVGQMLGCAGHGTSRPDEQRAHLERQAVLQEYMARLMGENLVKHQHQLASLRLRLNLLNTPRQAGFLRARASEQGPFDTYWAELRRDKRIYFFAHTAAQGSMPLFALELSRIEHAAIVEIDGAPAGRPLNSRTPLLELTYSPDAGGGRIQILSYAIERFWHHAGGTQGGGHGPDVGQGENGGCTPSRPVGSAEHSRVWQLMFPTDCQLHAWLADLHRLMTAHRAVASLLPEPQPLRLWVGSWNAGNLEPPYDELPLSSWLLPDGEQPSCDMYVVGFQELGSGSVTGGAAGAAVAPSAASALAMASGATASIGVRPFRRREREPLGSKTTRSPPKPDGCGIDSRASGGRSTGDRGTDDGAMTDDHPIDEERSGGEGHSMPSATGRESRAEQRPGGSSALGAMAAALLRVLGDEFVLIEAVPMYQIHLFVLLRVSHSHMASRVAVAQVPTFRAAYNKVGTQATPLVLARRKGGVAISLSLGRTSYCFVTAHLAAHQGERGQLLERNRDSVRVLHNLLGADGRDTCTAFDHLYFFGDLNYRLGSADMPDKVTATRPESVAAWDAIVADVEASRWDSLYDQDQVRKLKSVLLFA